MSMTLDPELAAQMTELTAEAIAETETEIFDEALGNEPLDNDGDTSLEQMDDDDPDDDDAEEEDGEDPDDASQDDGDGEVESAPARRGIPSERLRQEADARRVAEAEAASLRQQMAELRARQDLLDRQSRPAPPVAPKPPPAPDMFADPEGWARHQREQILQEIENQRVQNSLAAAAEEHGQAFMEAFEALRATNDQGQVQVIIRQPNPGRAIMNWHSQRQAMAEIGNNPAAYRDRLREEVRQELLRDPKVLSGARDRAIREGRTQTRLPPSLNRASGGASHRSRDIAATTGGTEKEIFDSVWK